MNNNNATNTTYAKVVEFIKADKTDQNFSTSRDVCSDFAEDMHNNAERAGIKTARVTLTFINAPGHACNAFYTTIKEWYLLTVQFLLLRKAVLISA